jgi:hypothetical protein
MKAFRHWQVWFGCCLGGIFVALIGGLGRFNYGHIGGLIGSGIGGGIGGFIIWEINTNVVRPHIREYLNSHDKI